MDFHWAGPDIKNRGNTTEYLRRHYSNLLMNTPPHSNFEDLVTLAKDRTIWIAHVRHTHTTHQSPRLSSIQKSTSKI